MTPLPSVLCVGIATLDIVNTVTSYPAEDAEQRALAQERRVGGNAANTARALARLGHAVTWAGHLTDQQESAWVEQALAAAGVASAATRVAGGRLPVSCITLARDTGSRTIVHFRDLPEYPAEAFARLPLGDFDWIHFEGRAVVELTDMLEGARSRTRARLSLEVEKPRPGIESLFGSVDQLMFSRDYARAHGGDDPAAFLAALDVSVPATCAWGGEGAWARDAAGRITHRPAYRPPRVVDTLGAGDVLNAGLVSALSRGRPLDEALAEAVRLAGEHCGRPGGP